MLCQNCKKYDATIHLKRIINGETAEIHLCHYCAKSLGVSAGFPSVLPSFGITEALFGNVQRRNSSVRCENCGFSFDDIVETGKPGCPECYRVFGDKLAPVIRKIHGRTSYNGKIPGGAGEEILREHKIDILREKLNEAIDEQNFERAAQLRDEIRKIMKEG